jgi:hypothetical protein
MVRLPEALQDHLWQCNAFPFRKVADGTLIECFFLQTQSAKQIQQQDNEQNRPDDTHPSAPPPSRIPVVAATSTEQEHQNNNQK